MGNKHFRLIEKITCTLVTKSQNHPKSLQCYRMFLKIKLAHVTQFVQIFQIWYTGSWYFITNLYLVVIVWQLLFDTTWKGLNWDGVLYCQIVSLIDDHVGITNPSGRPVGLLDDVQHEIESTFLNFPTETELPDCTDLSGMFYGKVSDEEFTVVSF